MQDEVSFEGLVNVGNAQYREERDTPALPGEGVTLSDEQEAAIKTIEETSKRVVVLTGQAGSGKSTIINHLKRQGWWTPTATTGKAAMHIGGHTVDSVFCFNRDDWEIWNDEYLMKVMYDVSDNIIIDEASMIGKNMGDVIFDIAKAYKKKLLLVGDWAQASPVKDDSILDSKILSDFEFIKLTENHRQGDGPFIDSLNKIRLGIVDDEVNDLMKSRELAVPPDDDHYLRMYATNKKTRHYNQSRLWRHVADVTCGSFSIFATFKDMRRSEKQKKRPRNADYIARAIDASPFSHDEPLALGCRVLVTLNCSNAVNGDTGNLVDVVTVDGRDIQKCVDDYMETRRPFSVKALVIRLDRTGHDISIEYMARNVKDTGGFTQHTVSGFPVQLGYACTIHKSQGMTVDKAWFDMKSLRAFPDDESRHGLAYVALSRARSLEGLLINEWDPNMIFSDPAVRELI